MMDPKHVKPDSLLMSPSVKFKFRWWFSRIYIHVIVIGLLRAVALPLSNAIPTWVAYLPSQLALFFLVIRAISFGFYLVEKDQLNSTHQGVGLHVWVTVAVAVILQLRHPLVAAGVRHHSKISMRRLLRTTIFANVFLNGSFSDQEKVIEWLSRVHRNIKGTVLLSDIVQGDPDMAAAADLDLVGAEYGLSEELQVWVLATAGA
ncbi:hypothetical protein EDD21DRAFT_154381 [Dissophora ornata]|nr:hypothetical protein EDD21DRAFT_154381 [Dissophora ornata]